jgi:hypothetical protein
MNKHRVKSNDGEVNETVRTVKTVGSSIDPAVTMPLAAVPSAVADIPLLAFREVKSVGYLFMISPNGMICPVVAYKFDNAGDLHATINLKQGDSGSPIVAVMNDGTLRLAGTVSRGTVSEGRPNIISSVASDDGRLSGSPGHEEPYFEIQNVRTSTDLDVVLQIERQLEVNRDLWKARFHDVLDKWDEREKKWDWDGFGHEGDEPRRKAKARVKSWKRDASNRKRGFAALVAVSKLSDDDKEEALSSFNNGEVRRFNFQRGVRQPRYGLGYHEGVT